MHDVLHNLLTRGISKQQSTVADQLISQKVKVFLVSAVKKKKIQILESPPQRHSIVVLIAIGAAQRNLHHLVSAEEETASAYKGGG